MTISIPAIRDIDIPKGGKFQMVVLVTDANDQPENLTGYTGEMQIRAAPDETAVLATGTVVIDAPNGLVTVTVPKAQTVNATWVSGVYDVRIISGGEPEYIAAGRVSVVPTVTR